MEKHYERYNEADFERFHEYQKAILFFTISDVERTKFENQQLKEEKSTLERKIPAMIQDAVERIKTDLQKEGCPREYV